MPGQVKAQPIYIPTGYEGLQQSAAQKRKLAEMMYGSGQTANPISITQVLGDLAKFYVGRRLDKKADSMELDATKQMGADYNQRWTQFQQDTQIMSPKDLIARWGNDPFMHEALKPYVGAMETGLKENEGHRVFGGRWMRNGDIRPGQADNNPNDRVIQVGDQWTINPVALTGSIAAGGNEVQNGVTSMTNPNVGGNLPNSPMPQAQQPAPSQELPAVNSQVPVMTMDQVKAAAGALGPEGTVNWLKQNGIRVRVRTPEEANMLPSGTDIELPDGSPGKVP